MTPYIQPSQEQKSDQQKLKEVFDDALEKFKDTRGVDLEYRELLKSNPSLDNYFKKFVKNALYNNLEIIDLLLSNDPEFSKIKIENKSILRCLIEDFGESISSEIINEHIKKFDSIGEDKDIDGDNLITSLLIVEYAQYNEPSTIAIVTKLIKILIESGVSVNDKNNLGDTPLDFCWSFEIFKTLAQHASQETLEKKLRYIVENEDLASEAEINITKFLLTEKNVKIDGFFDWKWPEIPIYRKAIFAQIVLEYGNDEQKKCLQAYSSRDAESPFFAIIDDDIRFDSEPSNFKEEIKKDRITMAIILNKKEALEKIIIDDPEILKEEVKSDLTPVFYAIDRGKLNALDAIIRAKPEVLDQKDMSSLPVFYAIRINELDALEVIINFKPQQVLDQKDENGLTPVLYAIKKGKLDALEKIISTEPKVLDQKDQDGLTPVFHAIYFDKLGALKKIIEIKEGALEQKNQQGENPILFSLRIYSNGSSEEKKEILKVIFKKQFGEDLQDKEIENLVKFVDNYNFLKLFYNQSGQGMVNNNFKSILSSVLPKESELEVGLPKKLFKIYETIAKAGEETFSITLNDGEDKNLHIYKSQLLNHSSYFIFHVNDQNKLTKISYCDGNQVFPEREIIRQDGTPSGYIHGAKTFELEQSQDFNQEFVEVFIETNSKKRKIEEFYSQEFSSKKLLEEKKIFEINFLKITHSIPTKMQSRGNCSLKSSNILARFLLTHQEGRELFTYSKELGAQGGEGYRPYKDLRQKMVDKAVDNLSKTINQLPQEFTTKLNIYREISSLFARSKSKIGKQAKKTTKLTPSPSLLDKINREKYLNADHDMTSTSLVSGCMYIRIATSHFNFTDQDKALMEAISTEVKIDRFLTWDFETSQAKNNFVKLVFDYGDEVKKGSFIDQLVASDPGKRNKFFEELDKESLSLILTAFEKQKSKFENFKEVIESLKANKKDNPHGIEGCINDKFHSRRIKNKNKFVKKVEKKFSGQGKDAYIGQYLNADPGSRKKHLFGLKPKRLRFILSHSQKILKKLENSDEIITELKIYAQRIDQKLVVEAFSEGTIARYKRSANEISGGDDDSSYAPIKRARFERLEENSVAKCSSSNSLQ